MVKTSTQLLRKARQAKGCAKGIGYVLYGLYIALEEAEKDPDITKKRRRLRNHE